MTNRLPEVREEDASAAIAAIYADIKRATDIPYVNLIFRHLALEPEVLAWAWSTIGPLYHDGRIAEAVTRLRVPLPASSDTGAEPVWSGMTSEDAAQIQAVLAFYNRGNPANLIGLSTLVAVARKGATTRSETGGSAPVVAGLSDDGASEPGIPPLPRPEQIAAAAMAQARELAARQGGADIGVVPSLYLHLSLWPDAMAAAHRIVLPVVTAADWPQRVADTIAEGHALASELAASVRVAGGRPPADVLDRSMNTVEKFTNATIPEMVVIGRILAGNG